MAPALHQRQPMAADPIENSLPEKAGFPSR
jgi:hypothetical protein